MATHKLKRVYIKGIQFKLMSAADRDKLQILEITNPNSYDNLQNPTKRGVYDPALGCYRKGNCETCGLPYGSGPGLKLSTCPGHFGIIKLPLPVFNPLTFDLALKLLKCSCLSCGMIGKRKSECMLFVKQMEATKMSLFNVVDKLTDIHKVFVREFGVDLENIRLEEFTDLLNNCIKEGKDKTSEETLKSNSRHIQSMCQALCKEFLMKFPTKCTKCRMPMVKLRHDQDAIVLTEKWVTPYLTPVEARKALRLVWKNDSLVLKQFCPMLEDGWMKEEGEDACPTDIFFQESLLAFPPRSRPPDHRDNMVVEDNMSTHLIGIIKVSEKLKGLLSSDRITQAEIAAGIHEVWTDLQMRVNKMLDKNKSKMLKTAPPGIKQLFEKKEGLLRWNVMGKRVNYAARSVISPDPTVACNEVGVPREFAKKLYITEPVSAANFFEMRKAVANGDKTYPGASAVYMENGSVISMSTRNDVQRESLANRLLTPMGLRTSNVRNFKMVKRHMKEGDVMILNRQPTLHKASMQAFKVKIMDNSRTLRINYSACKAFNADFDGDEMNAHLPQDYVARAEAIHIVSANEQFLVPKDGKPIGGLIQDHIVGGTMMTQRGTLFSKTDYFNLVASGIGRPVDNVILLPATVRKPCLLWTGKQVVSTVILNLVPRNKPPLTYEGRTKISDADWRRGTKFESGSKFAHMAQKYSDCRMFVRNGVIISGLLDKSQIGSAANGLFHYCYEFYGGEVVSNMMTSFGKLFTSYLRGYKTFSLGAEDIILTNKGDKMRRRCIKKINKLGDGVMAETLKHRYSGGDMEELRDCYKQILFSGNISDVRELDGLMNAITGGHQEDVKKSCWPQLLFKDFPSNALLLSVLTGSKGGIVNCMQLSCLLGQIDLEGSRPPVMASGASIAYFEPFDMSPRAGGFVFDRFCSGLRQPEFYFHCMAGRDGLIDTAVKTSRSGYLQRCLVKHMEGLKINYDGSVRDHDGSIIQFIYGGDGLDVMKTSFLNKKHFKQLVVNHGCIAGEELMREIDSKVDTTSAEQHKQEVAEWKRRREGDEAEKTPFLIFSEKKWNKAWKKFEQLDVSTRKKKEMCAEELGRMFDALSDKKKAKLELKSQPCPDAVLNPAKHLGSTSNTFSKDVSSFIGGEFKQSLMDGEIDGITEEYVEKILNIKYQKSLIQPGEAVGLLAATSMGEQTTQMTLNTFHFAGQNAMNVTLGVPRLREILMTASKNIKTPMISVPLREINPDMEREVEKVIKKFKKVPLNKVVKNVEVTSSRISQEKWSTVVKVRMHFNLRRPSEYKNEFSISNRDVLSFLEKKFFAKFVTKVGKKYHKLESLGAMFTTKAEAEGARPFKGDDDDDGNLNDGGGGDDKRATGNESDDSGDDDDDVERVKEEADDEEDKSSDEEGDEEVGVKKDDDDEEDDDDDGVVEAEETTRKRKIKTENGESVMVEEERGASGAKRQKLSLEDPRVKYVLNLSKKITKYEYDAKKNSWCTLEFAFPIMAKEIHLYCMVQEEMNKTFIYQVSGIGNCIMKDIEEDDSPLYMHQSAVKLQAASGLGQGVKRKKVVMEGSNIQELVKYRHLLCLEELYCNDIHEMARVFSVGVANKVIMEEIRQVFKAYSIDLDHRHLQLVADYMTFSGTILPFSRHGLQSSTSVIQKASFETALNFIGDAGVNNAYDNLNCPSSRIAVGRLITTGTGCFDLRVPLQ